MKRLTPYVLMLTALLGALVLPHVMTVHETHADEPETDTESNANADVATVIVKVPLARVGDLAAAVHALGGQSYDMDSLEPIAVPGEAPRPRTPEIADITPLLRAVRRAETSATGEDPGFRVARLDAGQRRMRISVDTGDAATFDRFVAEVLTRSAAEGWVIDSAGRGALQRTKDGRQRASLVLKVRAGPRPRSGSLTRLDPLQPVLPNTQIQRLAANAGLQLIHASPVRQEPRKDSGTVVVFRDYTFAHCYADEVEAFVDGVSKAEELVVSEIRLGRAEPKQQDDPKRAKLSKPIVRVAALRRAAD